MRKTFSISLVLFSSSTLSTLTLFSSRGVKVFGCGKSIRCQCFSIRSDCLIENIGLWRNDVQNIIKFVYFNKFQMSDIFFFLCVRFFFLLKINCLELNMIGWNLLCIILQNTPKIERYSELRWAKYYSHFH